MSNQRYGVLYVLADGKLLTEHASATMTRSSGSQQVMTVHKGPAGESPGSLTCEIDVTSAVPAAGLEVDFGEAMRTTKEVELALSGPGGKVAVSRGFVISDTIKHGVNSEATYDFKFRGSFPIFE